LITRLYNTNIMASTPSTKNILILGGSYGGISTAHHLLKHTIPILPDPKSYRIILISTSTQALCRPACPRALISDEFFAQDKLFVDTATQFKQYPKENFEFVAGSAVKVDHEARIVVARLAGGEEQTYPFYALVIATGASTLSPLFGFNGTEKELRDAWKEIRTALPTAKSILIAGAGPTGVETAGELGDYFNGKGGSNKVQITLVTAGTQVLPYLPASIASGAEGYLAKLGVTVKKNCRVDKTSPEHAGLSIASLTQKTTVHLADGSLMEVDLYIPAGGIKPNTSFLAQHLLESDGRVKTNPQTLRVDAAGPRIYAVGDASTYARPAIHNLTAAIPFLGANIKRDLRIDAGHAETDVGEEKKWAEDTRTTQLVPVGRSKGVGAAMGWRVLSFMVWIMKGRDYWLWTTGKLWSGKQWDKE
jgi:apoptosis-inducing factor 2